MFGSRCLIKTLAKARSKYNPQSFLFFFNINWSCRTFLMENITQVLFVYEN
jgi:hypothetical protein